MARPPCVDFVARFRPAWLTQIDRSPAIEPNQQLFMWVLPPLVIAPLGHSPKAYSTGLRHAILPPREFARATRTLMVSSTRFFRDDARKKRPLRGSKGGDSNTLGIRQGDERRSFDRQGHGQTKVCVTKRHIDKILSIFPPSRTKHFSHIHDRPKNAPHYRWAAPVRPMIGHTSTIWSPLAT
jgi:hypothetical protein